MYRCVNRQALDKKYSHRRLDHLIVIVLRFTVALRLVVILRSDVVWSVVVVCILLPCYDSSLLYCN